jgi:hypothetical protein
MIRILFMLLFGWKFRKRIRILPGITYNLSKKGVSTTIGVKGLSINKNKKGTHSNLVMLGENHLSTTSRGNPGSIATYNVGYQRNIGAAEKYGRKTGQRPTNKWWHRARWLQ